jgi:hypothetical protein
MGKRVIVLRRRRRTVEDALEDVGLRVERRGGDLLTIFGDEPTIIKALDVLGEEPLAAPLKVVGKEEHVVVVEADGGQLGRLTEGAAKSMDEAFGERGTCKGCETDGPVRKGLCEKCAKKAGDDDNGGYQGDE